MTTFSEFSLSPLLKENLAANGFVQPTPVQAEAIPAALTGSDVVATAQTGTGKTLVFALSILHSLSAKPVNGIGALVLTPTRELAIQIQETFAKLAKGTGIRSAVVVGGLNENLQLREIQKGAQVVIATPGRLQDFMNRRLIKLQSVAILVLDEADRMLDMGFLPTIDKILAALPNSRQTLFFSATIEKSIAPLIAKHVNNPIRVSIGVTTKPCETIDLHVYEVDDRNKLGLLRHMLGQEQGSFLVFARTKHGTDRLAKRLSRNGVKAICIHGDRTQSQRNQALNGFRQGYYRVLVATDVAARGIHVEGIAHVVNFDLPQGPEDFIHRAGRTGRAGNRGVASTFATSGERRDVRNIEKSLNLRLLRRDVPAELPVEVVEPHVEGFKSGLAAKPNAGSFAPRGDLRTNSGTKFGHAEFGYSDRKGFGGKRQGPPSGKRQGVSAGPRRKAAR